MKSILAALFVSTLALSASASAGEDSTDRWHGVGPAYYESKGGLKRFAECNGQESSPSTTPDCVIASQAVAAATKTSKNEVRKVSAAMFDSDTPRGR